MVVAEYLVWVREQVDQRLNSLLPGEDSVPVLLHRAMRYACLAPGKRIRPALCMAACQAMDEDPLRALDAACALEMVHVFSLIHDDLPAIDNDDLRRGQPTCHKVFGDAIAILAGDALFSYAFEVIARTTSRVEPLLMLAKATGTQGLVGGEVIDVLSEGQCVTREDVELIHNRKTAALIAASAGIGAQTGGGSPEAVDAMFQFGMHVGLAFQITDDILNETATAEQLGKAVGSDRDRNKATYPAIMGLDASRAEARRHVETAVSKLEFLENRGEMLQKLAEYAYARLA